MKILYLANIRLPTEKAHGLQIMKTCEAFAATGVTVELAVPSRANRIADDAFAYYGVRRNFRLTVLPVPDLVWFGALGFLVTALWFSEKVRWLRSFQEVDIVYSRDAFVLAQYVLLGRRLVFEAHGKPTLFARFVARRAHRVVVISKGLERAYEAVGIARNKIIVAPDAVDLELFTVSDDVSQVRRKVGFPLDKKIILYAGSFYLYAWKGVDVLLDTAQYLSDDYLVVLVGASEAEFAFLIRKYRSPQVRIITRKPHEEIPWYLRASDVLILPNKKGDVTSERYTSPLKLFEYMASGVPIVASRLASIEEILSEHNACLVEANDARALADGIQKIVANGGYGKKIAAQARAEVMNNTWFNRAQVIIASM